MQDSSSYLNHSPTYRLVDLKKEEIYRNGVYTVKSKDPIYRTSKDLNQPNYNFTLYKTPKSILE